MAFADDKNNFLQTATRLKCGDTAVADAMLTDFPDVPKVVFMYVGKLSCKPNILTNYLEDITDDADRTDNGIHLNKIGTINDPVIVVDGDIDALTFSSDVDLVLVFGNVTVDDIQVGDCTIGMLIVSGGAEVLKITKTHANAKIKHLKIEACDSYQSSVKMVQESAWVVNVIQEGGGYYGGVQCDDVVTTPCVNDVSSLTVDNVSSKSVRLNWTVAAATIGTEIFYRKYNAPDWLKVSEDSEDGVTGTYLISDKTKYVFDGLKPDTYYEFRVVNICPTGIKSDGEIVSQKTAS